MVYNAIWRASSSYWYTIYIYSYQVSMKSAKAFPRYGSGHTKHFFNIQRAITPLLRNGLQCDLGCIILLSIYILIPSFNEIRQSTSKIWLRTDGRTDNAKTISLRLWRGIIIWVNTLLLGVLIFFYYNFAFYLN